MVLTSATRPACQRLTLMTLDVVTSVVEFGQQQEAHASGTPNVRPDNGQGAVAAPPSGNIGLAEIAWSVRFPCAVTGTRSARRSYEAVAGGRWFGGFLPVR